MSGDIAHFPAPVGMIPEEHAVLTVSVVIEESAAYCGPAHVVEGGNIELHLCVIIHASHLTVQIFSAPSPVTDMGMTVEMGAEIIRQRQKLFQILRGSVPAGEGAVCEGENRFSAVGKLISYCLPDFFGMGVGLFRWRQKLMGRAPGAVL